LDFQQQETTVVRQHLLELLYALVTGVVIAASILGSQYEKDIQVSWQAYISCIIYRYFNIRSMKLLKQSLH